MKRTLIVVVLVMGLVAAGLTVAEAKKKKKRKPVRIERVVEVEYQAPALGVGAAGTGVCLVPTNSCGNVATGSDDLFLKVEVIDAAGQAVQLDIGQDTDPEALGTETTIGTVCGSTEEALSIPAPGASITTFPWAIGGPDCPGVATSGTIMFTLSNMP
ncbi:MAG: hypothetical protein ACRDI3_06430 [Actinomycetota bacterium]